MWLMVRQRFQLTYCLVLASTVIYCWSHVGMLPILLPRSDLTDSFRVSYVALALVATLSLHFMAEFLEPESLPRWMPRMVNWAGRAVMVIALAIALLPYAWVPLVEQLYVFAFLPFPTLALMLVIGSWRRGSRYAWMLLVAWSPPMMMALLRILHAANFIGTSTIVEHSVIIAMTAEAVLSAIAMTLRVTAIIRARETADVDARLARQLAENDPLTGLINRSALEAMVVRWHSSETLRLMLLDIDQFKQINARHSHAAGDALLKDIAAVITARIGQRASVARVSGGKFAVVGPVSDLSEATALALLRDVRGHEAAARLGATVSIGIAEGSVLNEADWNDLYHRTDQALLEAKASGRNRVVHSADLPVADDLRTQPAPRLAG
jgi:diguanylate cyclase (GGDEF)-like protein